MMKISSLIQTLTEVLANYGDKEVALINDATGELRYIESVSANEFADEVILDHVSYGEAFADEDFFSADDACDEMIEDGFVPSTELILLLMENPELLDFPELLESLSVGVCGSCDTCVHSNQFTLDDVASCNCCEDYSYYTPKSRY